jgi:hypothetical protein
MIHGLAAQNKTLNDALDTFTQANHGALKAVGKTAVVWEGQLLAFEFQVVAIKTIFYVRDGPQLPSHACQ